jgi:dihydroorotate dehydrogenase electron transfer subunit
MATLKAGDMLDCLSGIGNGYTTDVCGQTPLVVGGGAGVPPMYLLTKQLLNEGKKPRVVLGFNSKEDCFFEEEFRALGAEVTVTTVDGSYGKKGYVTDALDFNCSYVYACGPLPMLKSLSERVKADGQFSFEERMGCGFGACVGCSHKTKNGIKRICKDGPVLLKEEVIW